jgi:hypothetical protein
VFDVLLKPALVSKCDDNANLVFSDGSIDCGDDALVDGDYFRVADRPLPELFSPTVPSTRAAATAW